MVTPPPPPRDASLSISLSRSISHSLSLSLSLPFLISSLFRWIALYKWCRAASQNWFVFYPPQIVSDLAGVRGVVNTCDEFVGPVSAYQKLGIQQLRIPIVDYCAPSLSQIESAVKFMEGFTSKGEKVYVHCKGLSPFFTLLLMQGGKGRSTTIMLAYLMNKHKLTAQSALKVCARRISSSFSLLIITVNFGQTLLRQQVCVETRLHRWFRFS